MKLHLPTSLRAALLACLTAVAPIATSVATSSLIAGSVVLSFAPQEAQADIYDWAGGSSASAYWGSNWVLADDGETAASNGVFQNTSTHIVQFDGVSDYTAYSDYGNSDTTWISFGGISVTAGSTDNVLRGNSNANRHAYWHAADATDAASIGGIEGVTNFIINEDFYYGTSSYYWNTVTMYNDAYANIAEDATMYMYITTLAGGDYDMTVEGGGTLVLNISTAVTGTGTWTINEDTTLQIEGTSSTMLLSSAASSVTLNGGKVYFASDSPTITGTLVLTANGGTISSANSTLTLAGGLSISDDSVALSLLGKTVTLAEGFTVIIDGGAVAGSYDILNCYNLSFDEDDLSVYGASAAQTLTWTYDGTTLTLAIEGDASSTLEWQGGNGTWDSDNWLNSDTETANSSFAKGDKVTINTSDGESYTITANSDLVLDSFVYGGSDSYTIDATGYTLTTGDSLYAMGTGTLTINANIGDTDMLVFYASSVGAGLDIVGAVTGDIGSIQTMSTVTTGDVASMSITGDLTGTIGSITVGTYTSLDIEGSISNLTGELNVGDGTANPATFELSGDLTTSSSLVCNAGSSLTIGGNLTGDATNSTISATSELTIDGATSGITSITSGAGGDITLTGGIDGASTTVSLDGGTFSVGADSELAAVYPYSDNTTGNVFSVYGESTVTVNGGTGSGTTAYNRRYSYGYTIDVGVGSLLDDNVSMWMSDGAVVVQGGGTYKVDNVIIGSSSVFTDNVTLTIAEDTTMVVTGTETSTAATSSFIIGGGTGVISIADVYGTLELNSGISVCTSAVGSANLNVYDGGSLIMHAGLIAANSTYSNYGTGTVQVNIEDGATLYVGDDSAYATNYNGSISVNLASGSTITSDGVLDVTSTYTTVKALAGASVDVVASAGTTFNLYGGVLATELAEVTLSGGGTIGIGSSGSSTLVDWIVESGTTADFSSNTDESALALAMGAGTIYLNGATLQVASGAVISNDIRTMSAGSIITTTTAGGTLTLSGDLLYAASEVTSISVNNSNITIGDDFSLVFEVGIGSGTYDILTDVASVSLDNLSIDNIVGLSEEQTVSWYYDESSKTLQLTVSGQGIKNVVWNGGSTAWRTDDAWLCDGSAANFSAGDFVTIGSSAGTSATSGTITLSSDIVVGSLSFVSEGTWSLVDDGTDASSLTSVYGISVAGATANIAVDIVSADDITVTDSGSLNITGVLTEAGDITVTDSSASITGGITYVESLTVDNSSVELGDLTLCNEMTINSGSLTSSEGASFKAYYLDVNGGSVSLGEEIDVSYTFNASGDSTSVDIDSIFYAATLNTSAASFTVGSISNVVYYLNVTGGSFDVDGTASAITYLTVSGGASATFDSGIDGVYSLSLSDASSTTITGDVGSYGDWGTASLTLSGDSDLTITGALEMVNTLSVSYGTVDIGSLGALNSTLYMDNATMTIGDGETNIDASTATAINLYTSSLTISGLSGYTGSLLLQNSSITLMGDADFASMALYSSTSVSTNTTTISVTNGATVTINGGAGTTSSQDISIGYLENFVVNFEDGATLDINNQYWIGNNGITITGDGTMKVTSLLLGYTGNYATIELNIGEESTLEVTCTESNTTSYYTAGFIIGGAGLVNSDINVDGTLILNSGINKRNGNDGYNSTIDISSTGCLYMNAGLFATNNSTSDSLVMSVYGDLYLASYETDSSSTIDVYLYDGATVHGLEEGGTTIVAQSFLYTDSTTVSFSALADSTLQLSSTIDAANTSVNVLGGGTVDFAGGITVSSITIDEGSTLNIQSGISYTVGSYTVSDGTLAIASGLSVDTVSIGADGVLDASAGSVAVTNSLSVADGGTILMESNGTGLSLNGTTLSTEGMLTIGFDSTLSDSISQVLFTDVDENTFADWDLVTLDADSGIVGVQASNYLSSDDSWNLDNSYYIYIEDGDLVLSNQVDFIKIVWAGGAEGEWLNDGSGWGENGSTNFASGTSVIFDTTSSVNSVTVDAAGVNTNILTVSDGASYTFNKEDSASNCEININMGMVIGDNASATFNNVVSFDDSTYLNIGTGSTLSFNAGESITLESMENLGTLITAGSLTVNSQLSEGGTLQVGALTVEGDATITGLTSKGDVSIKGALDLGANSSITGSLTTTGNTTLAGATSIGSGSISGTLTTPDSLSVTSGNLSVFGALDNTGSITLSGEDAYLNLYSSSTAAGTVSTTNAMLNGDHDFTMLTATGTVYSSGNLGLVDGSSIGSLDVYMMTGANLSVTGDVEITSVSATGLSGLSIADSGELTVGSALSVSGDFTNGGSLSMAGQDLTLSLGTTAGGTLTAGNLTTGADSTFTKLTLTGGVSNTGTLSVGDGSRIDGTLDGGSLTSVGTVNVGAITSVENLSNTGILTVNSDVTVTDSFINSTSTYDNGTFIYNYYSLDLGTNALTLNSGTYNGGVVIVGDLTLDGSASFAQVTASGTLTATGQVVLGEFGSSSYSSTIGAWLGDASLINQGSGTITIKADTTIEGSFTNMGTVTIEDELGYCDLTLQTATTSGGIVSAANLTLAGGDTFTSLTLSGGITTAGGLSVATLTAGSSLDITLDYQMVTGTPAITIDSLVMESGGTLDINIDNDYLEGLNMMDEESCILATFASATNLDTVLLNGVTTYGLDHGGEMTISYDSTTGEVSLTIAIVAYVWSEDGDGTWGSNGWHITGDDTDPSDVIVSFAGEHTGEVEVDGDKYVRSMIVNDAVEGSEGYTYTNDSITAGSLSFIQGTVVIENTLTVTGSTSMGNANATVNADLTVASAGVLNTESMGLTTANSSFTNYGTTVVSGSLDSAEGSTIINYGSLTIGDGSTIASLEMVEGSTLTMTSGEDADNLALAEITSLTGVGTLYANDYAIVDIGTCDSTIIIKATELAKVNIYDFTGDEDAEIVVEEGASVNISGSASFSELTNNGTINLAGTLESDADLIITGTGTVQAEALDVTDTLSLGEDSTLVIDNGSGNNDTEVSIASYSSAGTLQVAGSVSFTEAVSSGGSVIANSVAVETATMLSLKTDWLVLTNTSNVASDPGSLIATIASTGTSSSVGYVLTANSIESLSGGKVTLDIVALYDGSSIDDGTYYLLTSGLSDVDYSWSDFDLSTGTTAAFEELVWTDGKDVILDDSTGSLILTIQETSDRTWYTGNDYASSSASNASLNTITPIWASDGQTLDSYSVLDTVDRINVNTDTTISLKGIAGDDADDSVMLNNLYTASASRTLTLVGDGVSEDSFTLTADMSTVVNFVGTMDVNDVTLKVDNDGSAGNSVDTLKLTNSNLAVGDGSTLIVTNLDASDANSNISGTVTLSGGTSTVACGYSDATLIATNGAQVSVDATNASGLSLTGASGTYTLSNASGGSLGSIKTTGATVNLGTLSSALTLDSASTVTGGVLSLTADASLIGTSTALVKGSLSLSNATLAVGLSGSADLSGLTADASGTYTLFNLGSGITLDAASTIALGDGLSKYFTSASVSSSGALTATRNDSYYNGMGLTENGISGLNLVSKALAATDLADLVSSASTVATISGTSAIAAQGDLADVMADMDTYMASGATRSADTLAAAVAGATTTSLGSAMMADVERQLRTTRNRTRSMGVDPTVVNPDMPYYNAWIAAEGSSSKLDSDSTHAGHNLTNTGGAIGVDVDLNDAWSVGASFTALIGDLDSDGADTAKGDFDTMYASVYARANKGRWNHSFVASYGMLDATLDRTVRGTNTSYTTKGDTSGTAFGLMYEVGYTYAVTEDASTCIQPVFSVSMVNSNVDGYTEKGSDATLKVGDQKNTYVTFGVGGVIETIVGEDIYNRASVFSGRVMLKADAGERSSEADVTLSSNTGVTETVKGADVGSIGIELGVGLTIPVTEDVGAIFIDASCDLRSGMTSFSGTVGYRFSF